MREIRAFVGHSFSPSDDAVVGAFLKYFEQLKHLLPNFSWEHAEAAEPIELAEKVRTKFGEKNLFIGICTANEFGVSENALSTLFLS